MIPWLWGRWTCWTRIYDIMSCALDGVLEREKDGKK
jgi:hypothetical protein